MKDLDHLERKYHPRGTVSAKFFVDSRLNCCCKKQMDNTPSIKLQKVIEPYQVEAEV
jgi:hypothetical protein